MSSRVLPTHFYQGDDVVKISRKLLGKVLCTKINGKFTSGIITETEAYAGRNDKACHANNGRRTERTEIMYHAGGVCYIYLCYGIHHLFNVVTNVKGQADAVLIRAIKPVDGIEAMLMRRKADHSSPQLTAGPGRLSEALGITKNYYGTNLTGNTIWIEDRDTSISERQIQATPRVGVAYAGKHAERPWRFLIKDSSWVS